MHLISSNITIKIKDIHFHIEILNTTKSTSIHDQQNEIANKKSKFPSCTTHIQNKENNQNPIQRMIKQPHYTDQKTNLTKRERETLTLLPLQT